MKKYRKYINSLITSILLFDIFTILTLVVDVKTNPLTNKEVGFYTLNQKVFELLDNEYYKIFDVLSDIIRVIAYGLLMIYVIKGFIQLVTTWNLKKVNQKILALGVLVLTAIALKFMFDYVFILGYRPILVDNEVHASYPSSHIFITTFILCGICIMFHEKFHNKKFDMIFGIIATILIVCQFCFRLLAKMHWLTDCIAGLILGLLLINILYLLIRIIDNKEKSLPPQ